MFSAWSFTNLVCVESVGINSLPQTRPKLGAWEKHRFLPSLKIYEYMFCFWLLYGCSVIYTSAPLQKFTKMFEFWNSYSLFIYFYRFPDFLSPLNTDNGKEVWTTRSCWYRETIRWSCILYGIVYLSFFFTFNWLLHVIQDGVASCFKY